MAEQPKRSWWSRHWKWVVPVGCLTPILICGGLFTLVLTMVVGTIKSIGPYSDTLAMVQSNPRAQQLMGTPIEAGFLVGGEIETTGSSGHADFSYAVSGPNDSGTVYVVADKQAGQWNISTATLDIENAGESVDLLANTPSSPEPGGP